MKIAFFLAIILNTIYTSNLSVVVSPDTIFVGNIVELKVSVNNLLEQEIPLFKDIEQNEEKYTILNKLIRTNYVIYTIQIWENGNLIIPSITVDIKNNKTKTSYSLSSNINFEVYSNINDSKKELKKIKEMKTFNLNSKYITLLLYSLILFGLVLAIYIYSTKSGARKSIYNKGHYRKNLLSESIYKIENIKIPDIINAKTTEIYYFKLSMICRSFIKQKYFIKATEMTSNELSLYFEKIGIKKKYRELWDSLNKSSDMIKYAKQMPSIQQFSADKQNFIDLIKSFNKIKKM